MDSVSSSERLVLSDADRILRVDDIQNRQPDRAICDIGETIRDAEVNSGAKSGIPSDRRRLRGFSDVEDLHTRGEVGDECMVIRNGNAPRKAGYFREILAHSVRWVREVEDLETTVPSGDIGVVADDLGTTCIPVYFQAGG